MADESKASKPKAAAQAGKPAQGGIIEREGAIHLSNVMLVDPQTSKPTRVGVRELADGKKARIARRSGEIMDKV